MLAFTNKGTRLTDLNDQQNSTGTPENPSMEWDIDNLPNRLTIFRLILVPSCHPLMFNLIF